MQLLCNAVNNTFIDANVLYFFSSCSLALLFRPSIFTATYYCYCYYHHESVVCIHFLSACGIVCADCRIILMQMGMFIVRVVQKPRLMYAFHLAYRESAVRHAFVMKPHMRLLWMAAEFYNISFYAILLNPRTINRTSVIYQTYFMVQLDWSFCAISNFSNANSSDFNSHALPFSWRFKYSDWKAVRKSSCDRFREKIPINVILSVFRFIRDNTLVKCKLLCDDSG